MIEVIHLFPKLNSSLIDVLQGLSPAQWNNKTVCKHWSVKDIAAHLLDTALRKVSSGRDHYLAEAPEVNPHGDLLTFLNALNAEWVNAYKRVSPQLITSQMISAQDEYYNYLQGVDLHAPAMFPVSWAGEDQSVQWFDIAREYTERWHHQQQIRLAVGAESILQRELYFPFLETCMLALPFHYSGMEASIGTSVTIHVVGEAGGTWSIVKDTDRWSFKNGPGDRDTQVYIDQNIAWLLFSRGIDVFEAEQYWQVQGDYQLGFHALKMKAFMV